MSELLGSHISHEAVQKVGGIGAVISGVVTSQPYQQKFKNTFLYAPLFDRSINLAHKLGTDGEVLYSGIDNYSTKTFQNLFKPIEKKYNISIVYGKRKIIPELHPEKTLTTDVALVDISEIKKQHLDVFKFKLWKEFNVQSELYNDWDYEQYLRIAIPYRDILNVLFKDITTVHFSHEYMGVACALSVIMDQNQQKYKADKTVFYAHEVATARHITEHHPGHDVMFYNVLNNDTKKGISLESQFGSQKQNYRNELIKAAGQCTYVFAVSDLVKKEYQYLNPSINPDKVKIVYNAVNLKKVTKKEKKVSRDHLINYCSTLFNFKPHFIFTHVTRLINSKGIWRDIKFLHYLDQLFAQKKLKGFFILLSTLIVTGRPPEDIIRMEKDYGWPILHQNGWPDLVGMEEDIYQALTIFNSKSKVIKGVFLNQYGFNKTRCGNRVPLNADFLDLRIASDAEFGMSIYEPFGIAQIETFPFGGLPIISSACGSLYLLQDTLKTHQDLYFPVDFTKIPKSLKNKFKTTTDFKNISINDRNLIEEEVVKANLDKLMKALENLHSSRDELLEQTQKLSQKLSWNSIVKTHFLPHFY